MPVFNKKPLTAMVVMLTLCSGTSVFANEFSLQGDQIDVDTVGLVNIAANGELDPISATIPAPAVGNIPDINFTLVNNNTTAGQYDVRMGLVIQAQANNNRLEANLGVVRVTVDGTGTVTNIALLNSEDMTVIGRRGPLTLTYTSSPTNVGVIQTSGANVTISANAINTALINGDPDLEDLVNGLTLAGHYNYRIALQPVSGSFSVGTTASGYAPLARMQSSCALDPTSASSYSFSLGLAGSFSSAYAVHGVLSLGGATSPGAGFTPLTEQCEDTTPVDEYPPIPDVNDEINEANAALNSAQQAINNGDQEAAVDAINDALDALDDAKDLLEQQAGQLGEANQTQLLSLLETIGNLADTIADAQEALDIGLSDEVEELNELLGDVLALLTDKTDTLSNSELALIENAVTQVLAANSEANADDDVDAIKRQLDRIMRVQGAIAPPISLEQRLEIIRLNALLNARLTWENHFSRLLFLPLSLDKFFTAINNQLLGTLFSTFMVNPDQSHALTIPDEPGAIKDGNNIITARGEDGRAFRYIFTGISFIEPGTMANGLYNAPNGALYSVQDDVIIEFAAAPANLQTFESAINGQGFTMEIEGPGIVNIKLDNGDRVSTAFRFEDLADSMGECTSITFTAPTGHPTSTDYVFVAKCNNGIEQTLVPVVLDQALYDTIAYSGLNILNSRDTGYLQVEGVGVFRPDYFVLPLTGEQQSFFNANKNLEGVALQAGDFDGNGKTDYRLLTARGSQILWGL